MSNLLQQPPVGALLTDAVAGEGEAFVVWLCEEAEGAGLAVPAQPDLLGAAAGNGPVGRENRSSGVLKEERLLRGRAGGGRWEQGLSSPLFPEVVLVSRRWKQHASHGFLTSTRQPGSVGQ